VVALPNSSKAVRQKPVQVHDNGTGLTPLVPLPSAGARLGVNRPRCVHPPLRPPPDGPRHGFRLVAGVAKPRRRWHQVVPTTMGQQVLAGTPPRARVLSHHGRPRPCARTRRTACAGTPERESGPNLQRGLPTTHACGPSDGHRRHRPTATPNGAGSVPLHGSRRLGGYTRSGLRESSIAQSGAVVLGSLRDGSNLALEVCSISSPAIGNYNW